MKKIILKFFIPAAIFFLAFFCLSSLAKAALIGEQASFFVDSSYDALSRATLKATLIEEGERAHFYVENGWWESLSSVYAATAAIQDLKNEFDRNIYPKMTKVYGPIWEPGIDNDPKITILISRIKEGAGGYFNSADEYPKKLAAYSNEREMIYLNSSYYNTSRAKAFLAHEFQHLITFYNKEKKYNLDEEVWLNEARSEYASTLMGYDNVLVGSNLDKRISDFLRNPIDSLTEWANVTADYGSANLFTQYLVDQYGEQILTKIMQSPQAGIASINDVLNNLGAGVNFSDIFSNWAIANYLNNCNIGQHYCYLNKNLSKVLVPSTLIQSIPTLSSSTISLTGLTKDWSGRWYEFTNGDSNYKNLRIDFQSNSNFAVIYISKKIDGSAEVKFINLDADNKGIGFVKDFGSEVKSVILIPISQFKNSGFSSSEENHQFSYQMTLTNEDLILPDLNSPTLINSKYPEGSLIRAKGDYKVYVINNGYKRWILSSEIFKFYPHFGWQSVIEVTPQERDSYKDAWLVRADGDQKVYEINGDGTRHWLNMTAEQFSQSGRKWEMVYVINQAERNWYSIGADVMFR